jgi:chemotaxis protein methyltransferase WspC
MADSVEPAQRLADTGHHDQAAAMLDVTLAADPLHAQAWSLLGSIRLAQRRTADAEECFRRVVYLRPHDALALLQLGALAEARGDHVNATRLRQRAARSHAEDSA